MFHMLLAPAEIFRFLVEWLANVQRSLMFFKSISFDIMSVSKTASRKTDSAASVVLAGAIARTLSRANAQFLRQMRPQTDRQKNLTVICHRD
jgi:hypothetical protein